EGGAGDPRDEPGVLSRLRRTAAPDRRREETARRAVTRSLRLWIAIATGWTALALFFAISTSLTYVSTGRPANWTLSIERSLLEWWAWALLTPLVVWVARRYALDHAWPWRAIFVHLALGTILAVVKSGIDRAVNAWLTGFWIYWLASTV